MEGPAISRLRWHLEKARDLVFAYYWQRNPEHLEMAEHRVAIAQEIYDVIKGAECVKIRKIENSEMV